jgi:hypothetical protein
MSICIALPGGWGLTELSLHVNNGSAFLLFFGLPTAAGASFATILAASQKVFGTEIPRYALRRSGLLPHQLQVPS